MTRQRFSYWSCTRFADLVRGVKKPLALGFDEWGEWRKKARAERPLRFFFAEVVLNKIQNAILFPFDIWRSAAFYRENRFVSKTHFLKTGLRPGQYHELDQRILHGLFNELKDFVEVELAWSHMVGDNEGGFKFRRGRCPDAGIAHLNWALNLKYDDSLFAKTDSRFGKPTPQAKSAAKILELYNWWIERSNRPDPMEASCWSEYCKDKPGVSDKVGRSAFNRLQKIEDAYEKEDDKMIVRLVKLRKHLWT